MIIIADMLALLDREGIAYTFKGDKNAKIDGFSSLGRYKADSFTWIKKQENIPDGFDLSQIAMAIVSDNVECDAVANVIRTEESKRAFFGIVENFFGSNEEREAVGQFTYISPNAKLGKNVRIGHNCTLDGDITIGDNTVLENNISIVNRCEIGCNCLIHSGTAIGTDGFGYSTDDDGKPIKVKHFGGVKIGNFVEIGANTCIDRGTIDDTLIGDNVKIDNLVHIAHNVQIDENCMVITQSAICGSARLKRNCYIAPGAIVKNQTEMGENSFAGLGAVVVKDVEENSLVAGIPAREIRKVRKTDK